MQTTIKENQKLLEDWVKPELTIISIKEETLSLNGIYLEDNSEYSPS